MTSQVQKSADHVKPRWQIIYCSLKPSRHVATTSSKKLQVQICTLSRAVRKPFSVTISTLKSQLVGRLCESGSALSCRRFLALERWFMKLTKTNSIVHSLVFFSSIIDDGFSFDLIAFW